MSLVSTLTIASACYITLLSFTCICLTPRLTLISLPTLLSLPKVLRLFDQAEVQLVQKRFYPALKSLQELEARHLPRVMK